MNTLIELLSNSVYDNIKKLITPTIFNKIIKASTTLEDFTDHFL